jgi:4'-phosphopantetheinyl transferase
MPLIFCKDINEFTQVGIWNISEEGAFFEQKLNYENIPSEKLNKRQLEKLALRHLLNVLSNKLLHTNIIYDEFGKPFLQNSSVNISFSHKFPFVAVIISKKNPLTGIDIERVGPLQEKLADKFTNNEDLLSLSYYNSMQKCAIIWSAKEVLYKAYGKKSIDFKKHLTIKFVEKCSLIGIIRISDFEAEVPMHFEFFEDLIWVHSL